MNRARAIAAALLSIALLGACGGDPELPSRALPVKSFSLQAHSQRLFETYRQQTGEVKKVTTVTLHTTKFVVQVDCVGSHGKINILVGTTGSVGKCSTKARLGEAHILWNMDAKLPKHVTVVVTTDPRNTWSVAVDAGTHGRQ
jgi:flagellar biosynthesis GTPase FlhF